MRLALLISMTACREHRNTKNTSILTDYQIKYQQKLSCCSVRAQAFIGPIQIEREKRNLHVNQHNYLFL